MSQSHLNNLFIVIWTSIHYIYFCYSCPSGYDFCVDEGSYCYGTGIVAYGYDTVYAYQSSSTYIYCSDSVFGDPSNLQQPPY